MLREVVDSEVGAVRTQLLGRDREVDRLQQRVRRVRVPESGWSVQWPKDRNPMFFTPESRRNMVAAVLLPRARPQPRTPPAGPQPRTPTRGTPDAPGGTAGSAGLVGVRKRVIPHSGLCSDHPVSRCAN